MYEDSENMKADLAKPFQLKQKIKMGNFFGTISNFTARPLKVKFKIKETVL